MKRLLVVGYVGVLITAMWSSSVLSKTWHVPADQPTIALGLANAVAGDTVLVSCGTYYEYALRMKASVTLLSATGNPACVTIDAQGKGRVIDCRAVGSAARIEGFTVTGGAAIANNDDGGGGIRCMNLSSPWIVNCVITGNKCYYAGGGIYCYLNSAPNIIDCIITNNLGGAATTAVGPFNSGGGIACDSNCPAIITNCTLSNPGPFPVLYGGTNIWLMNNSDAQITGCTLSGSSNGIYISQNGAGTVSITDCTITGNGDPAYVHAHGVKLWGATVAANASLTNCVISDNTGEYGAGVNCLGKCTVTLTNCTLQNNVASVRGGGVHLESYLGAKPSLTAQATKFITNTAPAGAHGYAEAEVTATLVCSVNSLDGFEGEGSFVINNDGCVVQAVRPTTWGAVKAMYR